MLATKANEYPNEFKMAMGPLCPTSAQYTLLASTSSIGSRILIRERRELLIVAMSAHGLTPHDP